MLDKRYILEKIKDFTDERKFVCLPKDNKWFTYLELWEYAYLLSSKMKGGSSGCVVVILENGFELFSLYFAAMLANTTIVPIDPHKSQNEIDLILSENRDSRIIRDGDSIFDECKRMDGFSRKKLLKKISEINFEKDYMVTYTSGSTGFSKGVRHNLLNLFHASESFGSVVGLDKDYTMCHVMPMSYMAGVLNTIFMPFIRGSKVVIMPRFDVMSAISFWKTVQQYSINAFWLSPTMLNILLTVDRKGEIKEYLSQINPLFFVGTAPLYENIRAKFEDRYKVPLLQSYGLSETLFISTEIPQKKSDVTAVGYLLPEVNLLLNRDEEIAVDVPWMFLGYTNDKAEEYFDYQHYKTGDLGKLVGEILYITGRKKDLIIKGGMNISPKQIEDCIVRYGDINECAVSGINFKDEERIVCWYVSAAVDERKEAGLNKFIEDNLGKHCRIDQFIRIDSIPKNLNGKADKKRLVSEYV